MQRIILCFLLLFSNIGCAVAQSQPSWTFGYVPTAAEFNQAFANKQDFVGYTASVTVNSTQVLGGTSGYLLQDVNGVLSQVGPASTTINGTVCAIGQSCTVGFSTGSIVAGTTIVSGAASGSFLYNSAGVVGAQAVTGSGNVVLATSPALSGTAAFAAATFSGAVTLNGTLTAPSLTTSGTVAGSLCQTAAGVVLYEAGGNCYSAASVAVGTTPVSGGTSGYVLYDNAGTLGDIVTTGTGNAVLSASPTLTGTLTGAAATLSGSVTMSGLSTSGTIGGSLCETAAGLVLYISGVNCFTGATSSVTIGTTTVASGTNLGLFYQNGASPTGTIGELGISGSTLTIAGGNISCTTATASQIGCVKPDGTTITIAAGVITASTGGSATAVTVGTTSIVGGTSGDILTDSSGSLGQLGLASTLTSSGSLLGCTTATTGQVGCVKPDGTTITISGGVISSTTSGGSGTVSNCTTVGAIGYWAASGTTVSCDANATVLSGGGLSISPSATSAAINTTQSATGSPGNINLNHFLISSDNANTSTAFLNGWTYEHHYGGSAFNGNRQTMAIYNFYDTAGGTCTGCGGAENIITSGALVAQTKVTVSPTAGNTLYAGAFGDLTWLSCPSPSSSTQCSGAPVSITEMSTQELDTEVDGGNSLLYKSGMKVIQLCLNPPASCDRVAGSRGDRGYLLTNGAAVGSGTSNTVGWTNGFEISDDGGASGHNQGFWPISASGSLFYAGATTGATAAYGLNWSGVTFSNYSLNLPGFQVDGSGNAVTGNWRGNLFGTNLNATPAGSSTPAVTCGSGTITATSAVKYYALGLADILTVKVTLSAESACSSVLLTLPWGSFTDGMVMVGRNTVNGNELQGIITSAGQLQIVNYQNSTPVTGSSDVLEMTGVIYHN